MGAPANQNNANEKERFIPPLFKPLSELGVKLNINEETFAKGQEAFRVFRDEKALDYFVKQQLPNKATTSHKDYLVALLRISLNWNLIDRPTYNKESERLANYADTSTPDLLNQRLGFPNNTKLETKLKDDTRFLAREVVGNEKFEPVRSVIHELPDGWAKEMSLKYVDFREKSNKEQWQIVGRNSLKAAVAIGKGGKEVAQAAGQKLNNFVIFANLDFWNDDRFKEVYGKGKQFAREKVVEPAKESIEKNIKQPARIAGAYYTDFDKQTRAFHQTGKWPEGGFDNVNKALADSILRKSGSGDKQSFVEQGSESRNGKKRELSLLSIMVETVIKGVMVPLKFAFQSIRPVVQASEAFKRGVTTFKGWTSNVVRPLMTERFEGLRNGVSAISKFVRNGYRATSTVVGALGDAVVPAAITLVVTGNPIAAIAVGSTSLTGSLTARFLNAGTLPVDYTLARETVFKYGSYAGKMDVLLKNLKDFGGEEWQKPSAKLLTTVREEVAREGGASKVYMGANAARAMGLGMTLGFAFGLGPIGAVGMGLAFAAGNFGTSYIANRFLISPQYLNMAKFGLSQMPVNQILGVYFGGKWIEDQIRKLLANPKKWWREEWADFTLTGGLGNLITGATTITSTLSVGRWATTSVNSIAEAAGVRGVLIARSMAIGGVAGSIIGSGLGWLVFGIAPGVGAIVGGFVGSVVGGIIGASIAPATAGTSVFVGSFAGGFAGSFLGSFVDFLVDNARRAAEAFANFLGILSIAKFLATLASVLTAPLRRLTDYVELVVPIALGLIAITTISITTTQSASNTPVGGSGNANTNSESVLASIISPFISDISIKPKKEKLEILTDVKISVSSCYGSSNSNYYIKKNGRFINLKTSHGTTFSGDRKISVSSPLDATVFSNDESPLYVKSSSGEFTKSEETSLILMPNSLTSSYYILLEGISSELDSGEKVKNGYTLGTTLGSSFRLGVLTEAESADTYDPSKTINPCSENEDVNFPGFSCDIIPRSLEICVND